MALNTQTKDKIERWAIEVALSGSYVVSDGISILTFQLDGKRVSDDADM